MLPSALKTDRLSCGLYIEMAANLLKKTVTAVHNCYLRVLTRKSCRVFNFVVFKGLLRMALRSMFCQILSSTSYVRTQPVC